MPTSVFFSNIFNMWKILSYYTLYKYVVFKTKSIIFIPTDKLVHLCMRAIRRQLLSNKDGRPLAELLQQLPLPKLLKDAF